MNSYDEVRRALTYLRWQEDDVESIAPTLFIKNGQRAKPDATPATAGATAQTVQPAQPAAPGATPAVVATPGPTAPIPPGMPGANPFL